MIYGADVPQLKELAGAFESAAARMDAGRAAVSNKIQVRLWVGPVAVRFRLNWESQYSRMLHKAAEDLRGAAKSARENAAEQERASAASTVASVSAGGSVGSGGYTPEQTKEYEQLLDILKLGLTSRDTLLDGGDLLHALELGKIDYKSFSKWLGDVKGLDVNALFDVVGLAISAKELGEAIGQDDPAAQLDAGLEIVIGAVGLKVPGAGLAYDFGRMIGETGYNSLQEVYDSPGSALDYAARSVYGDGATFDNLTQDERDILMRRYEGWPGLAVSVGDSVGGAWSDFWRGVTTGQWRGAAR